MASEKEIKIPDIGGASHVDVIELLVKVGDSIQQETPLVTLESDKASMEIPSPMAGVVRALHLKVGDKVSEGDLILTISSETETQSDKPSVSKDTPAQPVEPIENKPVSLSQEKMPVSTSSMQVNEPEYVESKSNVSAGPSVRRLAHQLGVNLDDVRGTERKGRISKTDIEQYVKNKLTQPATSGIAIAAMPVIDFSQFGSVEQKPLSKIKRLTGVNVHRAWVNIPHVTQFDEADITDLEAFRQAESKAAQLAGYKLTMLAFVCKVVSKALAVFPTFNASLDPTGEHLIYKQYCNIGIAVETPNGLVVPVIKQVDQLSISDIAKEMARLSAKAREKGLMPNDMNGGCFTISSLGGIGGTAFTPIVNSPEVAILGLSRSSIKPVYQAGEFAPRLMLPLSLSYDHRVIDGAEAARFTRYIGECLSDVRRILL
jgi:pyruvate dehydrogenase E2 component (dihydrolipoamide acetyltransferase)